jgi:hypothetical protein
VTPVPLELPLRPAEAGSVANLIFDLAERKSLTDDLRSRLAGRAAVLRLTGLKPYFGSLARDPVHPSTYYLAVDGDESEPLLLHMALANAPTSSLFAKPLLVGRMPRPGGPEMVINCLRFGPGERENIRKFAASTDPRLLPQPLGPRPAIVVESTQPAADFPVAFEAFRAVLKRTGKNLAAFSGGHPDTYSTALWAAIRAGWRDGYSMRAAIPIDGSTDRTKAAIRHWADCSRFAVSIVGRSSLGGDLAETLDPKPNEISTGEAARLTLQYGAALKAAAEAHEWIRQTRSALKIGRSFDLEISFEGAEHPTSPTELLFCLHWMKSHGRPVQLGAPEPGAGSPSSLGELSAVARQYGCTLSLTARPDHTADALAVIGRATMGRISYRLAAGQSDLPAAIQSAATGLLA